MQSVHFDPKSCGSKLKTADLRTSTRVEAPRLRFRRGLPYKTEINHVAKPNPETPLGAPKAIAPPNCTSWISTSETSGHQVKILKDSFAK